MIVATGSILRPEARLNGPLPLIDVDELLEGGAAVLPDPGAGAALILDDDGAELAPTAAEALVAAGFEVEIATTHPAVADLIDPTQLPFILERLDRDGVRLTPNVIGIANRAGSVTLRHVYSERDELRDGIGLIVIAGRRRGLTTIRDELAAVALALPIAVVGDALSPRTLMAATAEGARAGASIGSSAFGAVLGPA